MGYINKMYNETAAGTDQVVIESYKAVSQILQEAVTGITKPTNKA